MKNTSLLFAVFAIAAICIAAYLLAAGYASRAPGPTSAQAQSAPANAVLFNSSQYAPYAYLVSGGNVSQQAKMALSGFNMSSSVSENGTIIVSLSMAGGGQSQSVTLKKGDRLYFLEASFGDDAPDFDSSLGDDGYVVVNSTGYVI